MISSLREVQIMLMNLSKKFENPAFKKRFLMTSPGCSINRISLLKDKLPGIPKSYIKIITDYYINGIEVHGFDISPYFNNTPDIVADLLEAYEDPFFPKEFMQKHKMYQIGSYNTDILCVTEGTDQFSEGEILYIDEGYDIYNPEDSQIRPIAKDFEQFLIVAGNLDEIHTQMQGDDSVYDQKCKEFFDRLKLLGVDEKYSRAWLNVF